MNARILVVGVALLSLAGCAKRFIPGTEIVDTDDTREILDVIQKFQASVEAKNADAIVQLAAPDFNDDAGTPDLDDDLRYDNLGEALKERFSKIDHVRLDMDVRRIDIQDGGALAVYYYTLRYEMPSLSDKPQTAAELKRMELKKIDKQGWRIVSGI
ncbi:MAG: DUF4440 domain-containing protein [Myxococcaceae bacterium]|nr:DUF4440 domain-containing protein [Myxococcaceae bacterium]